MACALSGICHSLLAFLETLEPVVVEPLVCA